RDGGRCVICGAQGSEIDHIASSSPELGNLQLLCGSCHREKTAQSFRPIEAGSPEELLKFELDFRIAAPNPVRACDDEQRWAGLWRQLSAARKEAILGGGSATT